MERVRKVAVQQRHDRRFDEFPVSPKQTVHIGRKPTANIEFPQRGSRNRPSALSLREAFPARNLPQAVRLQVPERELRLVHAVRRSESFQEPPHVGFEFRVPDESFPTLRDPTERQQEEKGFVRGAATSPLPDVEILNRVEEFLSGHEAGCSGGSCYPETRPDRGPRNRFSDSANALTSRK